MTREEAKSKASIRIQLFDAKGANKIIDKIYDDFEEELKKAYIEGGNDVWKALNCKELAK